MSRTFTLAVHYPAPVEQVFAAFTDRGYWLARLADSGADVATLDELSADADGGAQVVTTQAIHRDKLPALAAQFHPGDLQIARAEHWHPVRDGRARAEISGQIVGAPARVGGQAVLEPDDGGAKSGMNPRYVDSQSYTGTIAVANTLAPQRPNTTDGTAASRSIR